MASKQWIYAFNSVAGIVLASGVTLWSSVAWRGEVAPPATATKGVASSGVDASPPAALPTLPPSSPSLASAKTGNAQATQHAAVTAAITAAVVPLQTTPIATQHAGASARCPVGEAWDDATVAKAIGLSEDRLDRVKKVRALDNVTICTMDQAKLSRAIVKAENPKPDSPGEWASFRALQQQDEDGVVDPNGLIEALNVRSRVLTAARSAGDTEAHRAGISPSLWTALGPGNIGGRIRAIAIHPTNTTTVFAGSVSGGLWKTTDAGATWAPVNDFLSNLSISSLVFSPADPNTLYAATGEGFFPVDAVRGAGVFKSVDGGVTWNQLASTNPASNAAWYYVNRIAIHPTNANLLLAATASPARVFKSSDAGVTWTQTATSLSSFADIRFDPLNGNKAVLAPGSAGGFVQYSNDSGSTWTNSNLSTPGRAELAYSRQAGTLYASVANTGTPQGQVWSSSDGGVTWTLKSTPNHLSNQGWYNNAIWVDPTNANHVVVGGLDLYRSTDAGATFTQISQWFSNTSVHADHHAIVSSPAYNGTTNKTVYFGNDGGVYRAQDMGAVTTTTGWTKLNNGLAVTQFYGGAGHTGTNGRIIGGTQDNGSLVYPGNSTNWTTHFGGDGGYSAMDPSDGNTIYGEYTYLQIHRSTNGGATQSTYIHAGITDAKTNANFNFIAPFVLDPNNPNTLYGGGRFLWRTTDVKSATPTWTTVSATSTAFISQIAVAQGNADQVWFGRNGAGGVFKSTNGTQAAPTWTQLGSGVLPSRTVLSLLIDKDNHNTVYAGFAGYSTANLWKTTDGGATWTSIGASLPPSPIRAIQRHPSNAQYLYAGTEVGLFTSENGGTTWTTTNDGPANASTEGLFWLNNTELVAATHGRGMFKASASLSMTVTAVASPTAGGSANCSPNPVTYGSNTTCTALPNANYAFSGFTGDCVGATCVLSNVLTAKNVTANFTPTISSLTFTVTGSANPSQGGTVTCTPSTVVSNGSSTCTASAHSGYTFSGFSGDCTGAVCNLTGIQSNKAVTANFTTLNTTRLINLSTRGQVLTGNDVTIGGFVVGGTTPKTVLIRAVGPNLANYGVTGVLSDPTLILYQGQAVLTGNDDWETAPNAAAIRATGLAPADPREAAILQVLSPGAYTAVVQGFEGATGVGIVEVYEIDGSSAPFTNISTRGQVQSGNNAMIGGFIIQGSVPQTVLIRAVGPNLANYGVTGVLANPALTLYSGQTVLASNDDWGNATNAAAVQATGLAPANPLEAAILISLPPGAYTAVVSGSDGGSGVGIVEVFAR